MPARALALSLVVPTLALAAVGSVVPAASAATGPTCHGVRATIVGTATSDRLVGTGGPDVIVGLRGNDTIDGRGGDDLLCGGKGSDRLIGGEGDDALYGGLAQRVPQRYGKDVLRGDVLDGGAGADVLDAGIEYGRLAQVRRADTVSFASATGPVRVDLTLGTATGDGEDLVVGANGLRIDGSEYDDELIGSSGRDLLLGHGGDDRLSGGDRSDSLVGGRGDDELVGGAGSDFLLGRNGVDTLDGDGGTDFLVAFSPRSATVHGGGGQDVVLRSMAPGAAGVVEGGAEDNQLFLVEQRFLGRGANEPAAPASITVDRSTGAAVQSGEVASALDFSGFTAFTLVGDAAWTYRGTDARDNVGVAFGSLDASTLGGNDLLLGDVGDDVLDGGADTDRAFGGDGSNTCLNIEKGDCDGYGNVVPFRTATPGTPPVLRGLPAIARRLVARYVPGLR